MKTKKVVIKGKDLICPICGHDKFWEEEARIKKGLMKLGPDREAKTMTCEECRYIFWFED